MQDNLLIQLQTNKMLISIYLLSGVQLVGYLNNFDKYTLILKADNKYSWLYKHQIACIQAKSTTNKVNESRHHNRLFGHHH